MSDIQSKLNRHEKKQKHTTHEEKTQSVETDPQMTRDRNLFRM